jgi:hypothetical protein
LYSSLFDFSYKIVDSSGVSGEVPLEGAEIWNSSLILSFCFVAVGDDLIIPWFSINMLVNISLLARSIHALFAG